MSEWTEIEDESVVIDTIEYKWIKESTPTDMLGNPIYKGSKVAYRNGGSGEATVKGIVIEIKGTTLEIKPYFLSRDFTGIARVTKSPWQVVVDYTYPAGTLEDQMKYHMEQLKYHEGMTIQLTERMQEGEK
ncbi:MAG: hypothetical protein OEY52_17110 [Gammaproteobacteria bacterium]|nr:hypothetical protein [Gammaproteobacteria bacterium]